jgi:hypothetical protein
MARRFDLRYPNAPPESEFTPAAGEEIYKSSIVGNCAGCGEETFWRSYSWHGAAACGLDCLEKMQEEFFEWAERTK